MDHQSDPARTFAADQEAAKAQEETRDQQSWELNIRNGEAQAAGAEAAAAHLAARASFWSALSDLIYVAMVVGVIALVAWAVVWVVS